MFCGWTIAVADGRSPWPEIVKTYQIFMNLNLSEKWYKELSVIWYMPKFPYVFCEVGEIFDQ